MQILLIKLGATGDVVRTTPLLRHYQGKITWLTAAKNTSLLLDLPQDSPKIVVLDWNERHKLQGHTFDLAVNLEDDSDVATVLSTCHVHRLFGAYAKPERQMAYTSDSAPWFDLSLISRYGRQRADELKLLNRHTYQQLIFDCQGLTFSNADTYLLPATPHSDLQGDVAIAPEAGAVWPMKRWAYYGELKGALEAHGLRVNVLPTRPTLLEHLADVRGHRCVVCGDSLPMHLALGSNIPVVALFNCTSPWEIHGYGLLTKIVSPLLGEFFYKRGFDERATRAISLDEVLAATLDRLARPRQ